jgi:hypothetical protein
MAGEIAGEHGSEWAAMGRVAELLGVGTAEAVRKWVRQSEVDAGEFQHQGLDVLGAKMQGAAGFAFPSQWTGNQARTEYHATIRWMTRTPN